MKMKERLTKHHERDGSPVFKDGVSIYDAVERLCAYEDTSFSPEEIHGLSYTNPISLKDRQEEILKANAEGRLIIPPCKIGDDVFAIRNQRGVYTVQPTKVSEMFFTAEMEIIIVARYVCRGSWMVRIFPTHELAASVAEELNKRG